MQRAIRGTILSVMESWPLQLAVQAGPQSLAVVLTMHTVVTRNGERVGPHALRPMQRVRIEGTETAAAGMAAQRIEILG